MAKIKKYCRTHYNQILCNKQAKNCSSPYLLCDETIGDFSDVSDIEISESFFDKPVCDYTEADLPIGDDLFEGIDEKPSYSAKASGTKITIFDHLKAFVKGTNLKKDGRKKSRRKSGKKTRRRKSSKRKSRK